MLANRHSFDALKLPDGLEDELLPAVPRPSSKDTGFAELSWHSEPVATPVYEVVVAPDVTTPEPDQDSGRAPEEAAPVQANSIPEAANLVPAQAADSNDVPRFSFDADAARFLIVENMEGGLDMAMLGLEELAALAAASGRILIEPHVLWFPDDQSSALGSPLLGGQDEGPVSSFLRWQVAYASQHAQVVKMEDFMAAMLYRSRRNRGGISKLHLVYACPWPHHCGDLHIDSDECPPACRLGRHDVQAYDGQCPDSWKASVRELSANPPANKTVTMCASLAIPPEPSIDELARVLGLYSSWDVVTIRNFAGGTSMSRALPPGTEAGLPPGMGSGALRGGATPVSLATLPQDSKLMSESWGYRRRLEQMAMRVVYHSTGAEAEGSGHVPEYAALQIPHVWMRSSSNAGASSDRGAGDKMQAMCAELFAQAVAEELAKTQVSLLYLTSPTDDADPMAPRGGAADVYVAQLRATLGDRVTLFSIDTSAITDHLSPVELGLLGRIICQHAATLLYVSTGVMRAPSPALAPPRGGGNGNSGTAGAATSGMQPAAVTPPWCLQGSPLYMRWVLRTRQAKPSVNIGPLVNQRIGAFAWTLTGVRRRLPPPKKPASAAAPVAGRSPLPATARGAAPAKGPTTSGGGSGGSSAVKKPPVIMRASSKNPVPGKASSSVPGKSAPSAPGKASPSTAVSGNSKGRPSVADAAARSRAIPAPAAAAVPVGSDKKRVGGDKGKATPAPKQLFGFNPFAVKKKPGAS
eukprot:jgi/Mesvir1/2866/Mv13950-RA.1